MERSEKQQISGIYKTVWSIYWGSALVFLTINYRGVLGEEEIRASGFLFFFLFLAAIIGTALLCAFVIAPRLPRHADGKEKVGKLRPWHLLILLLVDIWCFHIMELVNNEDFAEMTFKFRVINVCGILIMSLILLLWLNSLRRAAFITLCIFSTATIIFYVVYTFRGEPMQLIDIFSLGTAMNAAKNYRFVPTRWITGNVVIGMCIAAVLIHAPDKQFAFRLPAKLLSRACALCVMIVLGFFYMRTSWNAGLGILTDLFAPIKTYREYGTTVGFFCVAKYMRLLPPDGYSVAEVERIAAESVSKRAASGEEEERGSDVRPVNILAIMNESWCDYRLVGDLQTDKQVMPFYDELKENTIKGHTLVCIRGGGTAKSEYEFLTGNSVKRYPGMVPYVSYFRHDQYSIVTTLESQGYASMAMHPYKRSNWKRPTAYELLNFDQYLSIEDFDDSYERIRGFVSDRGNYQKIIEVVEETEEPLFLFDITMQNHGGYTKDNYPLKIHLTGDYQEDSVERFLTLERETDDALQYLIEYFEACDEPTLILVFGDHYPTLPEEFTESISGSKYEELSPGEQVNYFSTPFLIWANYDIPEQEDVITSCNYLSTLLLSQTGLDMPDYNYYLQDLMQEMPALNHMGYYDAEKVFHTWEDGDEEILHKEWEYECLQYNELAESRRRLNHFFAWED